MLFKWPAVIKGDSEEQKIMSEKLKCRMDTAAHTYSSNAHNYTFCNLGGILTDGIVIKAGLCTVDINTHPLICDLTWTPDHTCMGLAYCESCACI